MNYNLELVQDNYTRARRLAKDDTHRFERIEIMETRDVTIGDAFMMTRPVNAMTRDQDCPQTPRNKLWSQWC